MNRVYVDDALHGNPYEPSSLETDLLEIQPEDSASQDDNVANVSSTTAHYQRMGKVKPSQATL